MNKKYHKPYQILMILIGLIWFAFSFLNPSVHSPSYYIIIALTLLNGAFFILFAFIDFKKWFHKLPTFVFLLANIILTFTDQFGLYDILILIFNILVFILFIILHRQTKK